LWEKELMLSEEKIVREHLSSCPECQREFEQFEKTMGWLHSVGEVGVPDGFLPELHKKMEERKKSALSGKARGGWFNLPLSLKLPAQAVAMVAIVFLVLYLTKMMPTEVYRLKETKQTPSPLSAEKKSEQVFAQKGMERERESLEVTPETLRPKDAEPAKAHVPVEKESEGASTPQMKAEAKKEETPSPKSEIIVYHAFGSKEQDRAKVPFPEPEKTGEGLTGKEKSVVAVKPPQEIVLRISDREKAISQLHELVKQHGGEIVKTEENIFLVSLPADSFSEFEKELGGLSDSVKADKMVAKKQATGSLRVTPGVRREEAPKLTADAESRLTVRILLIQE
jgi:hypothetical protein